jgi:hypothetical protein
MKFRNTLLLLILTAAVGAYVYLYEIKGGESREKEKESASKLLSIQKDSVSAITLKPDGIELKKVGGKWELTAPVQSQADESTVSSLLSSIESAQRDRKDITTSAADYPNYGLDPAHTQLVLRDTKGEQDTVYLGDSNATSTSVYARVNHDPEVVLTAKSLSDNAKKTLLDWRNKDLLTFETSEANRLLLKTPKDRFELKKEGGKWQMLAPIKAAADESKISAFSAACATAELPNSPPSSSTTPRRTVWISRITNSPYFSAPTMLRKRFISARKKAAIIMPTTRRGRKCLKSTRALSRISMSA